MIKKIKNLIKNFFTWKWFQPVWGAIFTLLHVIIFYFSPSKLQAGNIGFWLGWAVFALVHVFLIESEGGLKNRYKDLCNHLIESHQKALDILDARTIVMNKQNEIISRQQKIILEQEIEIKKLKSDDKKN